MRYKKKAPPEQFGVINTANGTPDTLILGPPTAIGKHRLGELFQHVGQYLTNKQPLYFALSLSASKKFLKKNFEADTPSILEVAENNNITTIGVMTPEFFRFATGQKIPIADAVGSSYKGIGEYNGYTIVPMLNYTSLFFQPQKLPLVITSAKTLNNVLDGIHVNKANQLETTNVTLLTDVQKARELIASFNQYPAVALDIEATGLSHGRDELLTISFATSPEQAYVLPLHEVYTEDAEGFREVTKEFFLTYTGEQLWYNALFDLSFIVRQLFGYMPHEQEASTTLINTWNITDVMHERYLTVNGLERTPLGLKDALMPYYGTYDAEVDQSRLIEYPFDQVGEYNGLDTTGTFLVHEEYVKKLVEDEQLDLFNNYYKQALPTILKLKLNGMPLDDSKLEEADMGLEALIQENYERLYKNEYIVDFTQELRHMAAFKYNQSHKVKKKTADDFGDLLFNPNSNNNKVDLFVNIWNYEVLEKTKTGNPSVGGDVLKQWRAMESDEAKQEVVDCILAINEAGKIRGTFVQGLEALMIEDQTGTMRVHGNYKLHGTMSGRLSASDPNMQNLPSSSTYGKLIKSLFVAPEGYIFAGADFNALEDRILAEETRDPAKVMIIEDGYDSHSYNSLVYSMEGIEHLSGMFTEAIKEDTDNFFITPKAPHEFSIGHAEGMTKVSQQEFIKAMTEHVKHEFPEVRQRSKAVTFGSTGPTGK